MSGLTLFAQAMQAAPALPEASLEPPEWLTWFYVWGEPAATLGRSWGGLVSWSKVVGLYCLMAWVVGWLLTSARSNTPGAKSSPVKLGMVIAVLVLGVVAALLGVLDDTGRLKLMAFAGAKPGTWLALASGLILLGLIEGQLWGAILKRRERADMVCLIAMHLAFALGYFVAYRSEIWNQARDAFMRSRNIPTLEAYRADWRTAGARIGGTYMGLVVLVRVIWMVGVEILAVRFRRIYSIAWQTIAEANRSNRAPYVVVSFFVVVLAFMHWFIRAGERDAELSRLFVSSLTFLCSVLLLLMIVFIAPVSMPRDIANQTIYTIVSKPVRRLELVWGRLVGYMTLVTVLLAGFGGVGLIYLNRTVGTRIDELRAEAVKLDANNKRNEADQRRTAADQLASRMSARMPLKGSLAFQDSKKQEHGRGIDVGQEQEMRTFVEGATESRAIWRFDDIDDPTAPGRKRDLKVDVQSLLKPGSIEAIEDRLLNLRDEQLTAERDKGQGNIKASDLNKLTATASAKADEIKGLVSELDALRTKEKGLTSKYATMPASELRKAREEVASLHSGPIPLEMTFTIYRTTKGILGEPVLASITATNPRPGMQPFSTVIPIREYYTNRTSLPSRVLVGSRGVLKIEARCVTANQYLGMAESDLYILAGRGGFELNYVKGLFGIWLQVLVLTSIGLFAGTFLSWPVAILVTLFFFLAGEVAFTYLAQFAIQALDQQVIGPFESLIRLVNHQNMMTALAATPAVVVAKTADAIVMPVMSRLVFLIPNFGALDVTNTVADGFAVTWEQIRDLTLMGLGYALPFSIAGYFILRNREVAA
jgi:ABC-type transport system involved in multi-copper enzyme maturation permease subunit